MISEILRWGYNGKAIAKGFATVKNRWMTETLVTFEGMIEFKRPGSGSKGTVVLKKKSNRPAGI